MGKIKCCCDDKYHLKQAQRMACLKRRGLIKNNGNKRIDAVVAEMENKAQQSNSALNVKQVEDEEQSTSLITATQPSYLCQKVEIISNFSMLRNGYRRLNFELNEVRHRNVSRLIKDVKEESPNILAKMEKEEWDYSKKFKKTKRIKRQIRHSIIKLSEKREAILEKLKVLSSKEWERHIEVQNFKGLEFSQIQKLVGIRHQFNEVYEKAWLKHVEMIRKGKFCKYDAKFYHIEELVEKGNWSELVEEEESYEKIQQLLNMSIEERINHMEKKEFFDLFTKETMKEIEDLLYVWEKRITHLDDGTIKFEKVKLCPINKYDYKETIKMHIKDIEPRFERLWNYFKENYDYRSPLHPVVNKDLNNYISFTEKLWNYFEQKRQMKKQKQAEERRKMLQLQENCIKIEEAQNQMIQAKSFGQKQDDKAHFVIESEEDFVKVLDNLLKLNGFWGRQVFESHIAYKICLLQSYKIRFIPDSWYFYHYLSGKQWVIVRFRDSCSTRNMLSQYLTQFCLFSFEDSEQILYGYKIKWRSRQLKPFSGTITSIADFDPKYIEAFTHFPENLQKQVHFLEKHNNFNEILSEVNCLLFLQRIRGKNVIKMSKLAAHHKDIQEFLDSFRHLFLTDSNNYIYCPLDFS